LRPRPKGPEAKAEAKAKILSSRPVCFYNKLITDHRSQMMPRDGGVTGKNDFGILSSRSSLTLITFQPSKSNGRVIEGPSPNI